MNSAKLFPPRRLGLAATFFGLLILTGCGDYSAYPSDLKYPLRTDPIVKAPSTKEFWYPNPPGRLEEFIVQAAKEEGGAKLLDPTKIPEVNVKEKGMDRRYLAAALNDVFGTPAGPLVRLPENEDTAITRQQIQDLKLNSGTLAQGSVLYRRHCMQCHGINGDGRGPTGPWVHPHPRDYRQGIFKFISTKEGKPRRDDLYRVLKMGVEGTSMPSFALLTEEELNALVSYVIHLSLRGEVEFNLCKALLGDGELESVPPSLREDAQILTARFVERWYNADRKPYMIPKNVTPPASEDERLKSVERGYNYFIGKEGACIKCHGDFGRQVPFKSDVWGTPVRPANLTHSVYRGGRRPVDLYWRVRGGIPPSGMPAGDGLMTGDDDTKVWDVVNFIQALPYPGMLPESVRDKVYDKRRTTEDKPHHASAGK